MRGSAASRATGEKKRQGRQEHYFRVHWHSLRVTSCIRNIRKPSAIYTGAGRCQRKNAMGSLFIEGMHAFSARFPLTLPFISRNLHGKGTHIRPKMKKKVILPLFLAAAVLASCGNGDVPSSGSEGGDSSSSGSISQGSGSESQGGGETDDKEDLGAIMALIDEAKAGSNYSYGLYDGEAVTGKIVLTKDYIYDTTSDSASIALDSYEGEGKLLYSLVHGSEGYEVRNALT